MNPARFIRHCIADRPAALRSARLVARSAYGFAHWRLRPAAPLRYPLATGGTMLLERDHSFTQCFWPGVDQYEPDVRAALLTLLKPGGTFIDCGANVGYFSVLAGTIVGTTGQVVAIEANPATYQMLVRNLALNGAGHAVHCALVADEGPVQLLVPQSGDVYSSLRTGGLVGIDGLDAIEVPGRTLDSVVASLRLSRVDVLKIDIEGGELDVLRSARRLLRTQRPFVICEYGLNTWPSFGATPDALKQLLKECDYKAGLFDTSSGTVTPITADVWDEPYVNLVLLPDDSATELSRLC